LPIASLLNFKDREDETSQLNRLCFYFWRFLDQPSVYLATSR
jgi:hypothetical protein